MIETLTEEQRLKLVAYLDGELADDERREIESLIENNNDARNYIETLSQHNLPIKEAFEELLQDSVPGSVSSLVENASLDSEQSEISTSRRRLLATGFGSLLVGVLGVKVWDRYTTPESVPDWVSQVANYQNLYVRETVANAAITSDKDLQEMMSRSLGTTLQIPDLDAHEIQFKRAQLLHVNNEPLLQLVYLPKQGRPIAICIKQGAGMEVSNGLGESHQMQYAFWELNNLGVVMVADMPVAEFRTLSEQVKSQLRVS